MIQIAWEFVVKIEAQGQFELAYGPGGAWSSLYGQCPGFRGITVLRDTHSLQRYLAFEIWDMEEQREAALAEGTADYAVLEASLDEWTESMNQVGVFSMLAQATVRTRSRAGRGRPGLARGGSSR